MNRVINDITKRLQDYFKRDVTVTKRGNFYVFTLSGDEKYSKNSHKITISESMIVDNGEESYLFIKNRIELIEYIKIRGYVQMNINKIVNEMIGRLKRYFNYDACIYSNISDDFATVLIYFDKGKHNMFYSITIPIYMILCGVDECYNFVMNQLNSFEAYSDVFQEDL